MSPVERRPVEAGRVGYLDNVRILLAGLVILFHAAVTYGGPGSWCYVEPASDLVAFVPLTLFVAVSQSFFMGLFFLIAAYFAPVSYDRKGARRFLADRVLRLGVPILFYVAILDPLVCYILAIKVRGFHGTLVEFLHGYLADYRGIHVGPLWFVQALLIFAVVYAVFRRLGPSNHKMRLNPSDGPSTQSTRLLAAVLGVVTFVVRIWFPVNYWIDYLNLQPAHVAQYVCLLVIGIIAYRKQWLSSVSASQGRLWLGISTFFIIALFPALFILGGAGNGNTAPYLGGLHWQALGYAVWEQFVGIGLIVGILSFFRNRLDRQTRLSRSLSASTYAAYIIHPVILVILALAIKDLHAHNLAKFALLGVLAVPACFAVADVIRRLPLARRVL